MEHVVAEEVHSGMGVYVCMRAGWCDCKIPGALRQKFRSDTNITVLSHSDSNLQTNPANSYSSHYKGWFTLE